MDVEKFKELKNQGLTNQQIANYFEVSLSTLKRFIREHNLFTKKQINEDNVLRLYNENKSDAEISKILEVPESSVTRIRRSLGLLSLTDKQRKENRERFIELYNQGLNDSEISRILKVNNATVHYWRKNLNLSSNFEYSVKFDTEKFLELYNQGLNDKEISIILGCSDSALCEYRKNHNLSNNLCNKDRPTYEQEQVIIGSVLGDMCIKMCKNAKHATGDFAHSLKQENYCKYKANILRNFVSNERYKSHYDKRTDKTYNCYYVTLKSSEYLTELYSKFYINGKKHIPKDLLYKLDGLGIAIWFMDDGYKNPYGYNIATNCFTLDDLEEVKTFFKSKYDINISVHKDYTIYIKADSKDKFTNLIQPYIHDDCLYKLHTASIKTPLNGETPKKDNPVLNLQETEENADRLEVMLNK